jgi:hypothetical protein
LRILLSDRRTLGAWHERRAGEHCVANVSQIGAVDIGPRLPSILVRRREHLELAVK